MQKHNRPLTNSPLLSSTRRRRFIINAHQANQIVPLDPLTVDLHSTCLKGFQMGLRQDVKDPRPFEPERFEV